MFKSHFSLMGFLEFSGIFCDFWVILRISMIIIFIPPKTHFSHVGSHEILVSSYASTKAEKRIMTGGTLDLEFKRPKYELSKIYDRKWDPQHLLFAKRPLSQLLTAPR